MMEEKPSRNAGRSLGRGPLMPQSSHSCPNKGAPYLRRSTGLLSGDTEVRAVPSELSARCPPHPVAQGHSTWRLGTGRLLMHQSALKSRNLICFVFFETGSEHSRLASKLQRPSCPSLLIAGTECRGAPPRH